MVPVASGASCAPAARATTRPASGAMRWRRRRTDGVDAMGGESSLRRWNIAGDRSSDGRAPSDRTAMAVVQYGHCRNPSLPESLPMSTRLPRLLAVAASLAAALLAPVAHAAPEPKVLNIYNWS